MSDEERGALTDAERLFVAQGLYKLVAGQVSTKDAGSLRSRCDAEMERVYRETGFKSADAKVGGVKVGTYSVRTSRARPESTENRLVVEDPGLVIAWAHMEAKDELTEWLLAHAGEFAEWALATYGEVPDGCRVDEVHVPAEPERFAGTTLRVDPALVAEALLREFPGQTLAGLLGAADA